VTAICSHGEYNMANILYETKIEHLDFRSSDECTEVKFFTKEEALEEDSFPVVKEFIKVYDLSRH
jgi:hypothetical protein